MTGKEDALNGMSIFYSQKILNLGSFPGPDTPDEVQCERPPGYDQQNVQVVSRFPQPADFEEFLRQGDGSNQYIGEQQDCDQPGRSPIATQWRTA